MITITTFNIQNDIMNYSKEKVDEIFQYLKDYHIDIFNLQEVYSRLEKDFNQEIHKIGYQSYGNYRFFLKRFLNRFNEKTPIITNQKILSYKTYHLPFLPSYTKRVMTKVVMKIEGRVVSVYNTHLDVQYEFVKKRQLKKIVSILEKDHNPIILTGDFNLKTNKIIFQEFIEKLKGLHLVHVDIHEKTWKPSQYHRAIDHIFLSYEFQVIDKKLITNLSISDHYPILLNVTWKQ